MLPEERKSYILNKLKKEGRVAVEVLAAELAVSPITIRRDLDWLAEQGLAYRAHGGALLPNNLMTEIPYKSKETINIEQKQKIGRQAASIVKEEQIIILDSGTTTLEIARAIKHLKNLTVVTNDLKIALELTEDTNIRVFCTGGQVQAGLGTLLGSAAEDFLTSIRVDIAFIAASAVDLQWGITSPSLEKANIKKKMIMAADRVVLVADHSKFGRKSFAQITNLEEIDLLITDDAMGAENLTQLQDMNVETLLV